MNSKSKIGVFSALLFGVIMLLIPATSIANAQEYGDRYEKVNDIYYEDDRYYEDNDEHVYEEYYYYPSKDKKKMKEPPMLLVKKDVLYCDVIANDTGINCGTNPFPGPESERYVQDCTADSFLCNTLNEATFEMIVTDNVEFPGSEDGTKLNFKGERYAVTEDVNLGLMQQDVDIPFQCQLAGFDDGFKIVPDIIICTENIGECSGIIQDGELKECTIKNYVVEAD